MTWESRLLGVREIITYKYLWVRTKVSKKVCGCKKQKNSIRIYELRKNILSDFVGEKVGEKKYGQKPVNQEEKNLRTNMTITQKDNDDDEFIPKSSK